MPARVSLIAPFKYGHAHEGDEHRQDPLPPNSPIQPLTQSARSIGGATVARPRNAPLSARGVRNIGADTDNAKTELTHSRFREYEVERGLGAHLSARGVLQGEGEVVEGSGGEPPGAGGERQREGARRGGPGGEAAGKESRERCAAAGAVDDWQSPRGRGGAQQAV